jgi:hypothetical protein
MNELVSIGGSRGRSVLDLRSGASRGIWWNATVIGEPMHKLGEVWRGELGSEL